MTKAELVRLAAEVNQLWPRAGWEAGTVRASEALLLDLDVSVVLMAIRDLAVDGREFAPAPGLIRKRAVELERHTDRIPDADEALREVYTIISRVGVYREPEWSSPAIAATVDALGGWEAVCMDDNPEAFRAHFMRLYGTCAARVQHAAAMPPDVAALLARLDLRAEREVPRLVEPVPALAASVGELTDGPPNVRQLKARLREAKTVIDARVVARPGLSQGLASGLSAVVATGETE